jgi:Leucine-rich repeat (LRR) protein
VARLTKLHSLLVSRNALEDLPEGMAELRLLVVLDLSHNQLRTLCEAVGRLRRLRKLRLTGNPFCGLPSVAVDLQVGRGAGGG